MSGYALSQDLWQLERDSDRRFRRLLLAFALPALVGGVVIPWLQMNDLQRGAGEVLPQRYAKLIADSPQTEAEQPKPEAKPQPVKPKPQVTQEQKVAKARAKASKLLKSFDQLSELRDADLPKATGPLTSSQVLSSPAGSNPSFAASAAKSSGGIGEVGVVSRQSETALGQRQTAAVKSRVGSNADAALASQGKSLNGRSLEEIQLVFDRSKASFYALYNRALRERPEMQGKVVVRMTIAPSGAVTRCTLVSSDLHNPDLEQKLVARVLLLQFPAKSVPEITIDFPFTLFPSS
ncbi:MAG TPA: AgmX/PglI C-terminal domain-containing protein [Candidatus Binatia bacterium]|nr:AgmX/PglI C-terminal domain-containing protein [Candidatus Binatia bacterium]